MFFDKFKKKKWTLMAATDIGTTRQINQDNLYLEESALKPSQLLHFSMRKECEDAVLCAVCDGMGGGAKGEEAAYLAVEMLGELRAEDLKKDSSEIIEEKFKCLTQRINNAIYEKFKEESVFTGCTITLLYTDDKRTIAENVGDSPCILLREGKYEVVSISDNRANLLYQMGRITEEERWIHKTKNQLTQYAGMNPNEVLLSPHIYVGEAMQKGDMYILSSDGMLDKMGFDDVLDVTKVDYKNTAEVLVDRALRCGSRDNVTVIVVKREK